MFLPRRPKPDIPGDQYGTRRATKEVDHRQRRLPVTDDDDVTRPVQVTSQRSAYLALSSDTF